jgi:hypothetical protein
MSEADKPKTLASEPFVPGSDRIEPKPDARIADLTVRDLLGLLQGGFAKHSELKAFYSKHEQWKVEHLKLELFKAEFPKVELYKTEHPDIPIGQFPVGPGPEAFSAIAQGIAGLQAQVQQLSSEVAELRKAGQR